MKEVNMQNFDEEVLASDVPVLVDFWAAWCGPCRAQAPILEQLESELDGKVKLVKLNVDESPEAAMAYGVASIPTLILFKGGNVANKAIGLHSASDIKAMISEN